MAQRKRQPKEKITSSPSPSEQQQQHDQTAIPQLHRNLNLSNVWVDRAEIRTGNDKSLGLISLFSHVPVGEETFAVEVFRFVTPVDHLQRIVDVICKQLNYYPEKPE